MRKIWYLMAAVMLCVIIAGGCGGGSSSGSGDSGSVDFEENTSETFSASDLEGTWKGSNGTGSGGNQKYLPNQVVPLTVEYVECTISNIDYSETSGTGTADLTFKGRVTNSQYNLDVERNKTIRSCRMLDNGHNSWSFHAIYSDGEDGFSLTLSSQTEGLFTSTGVAWNEDDTSDRTEYQFSCKVNKQ